MNTRRILYAGRWWDVPCRTRNQDYVRARNAGKSHAEACISPHKNWMSAHTLYPLASARRNVRTG